MYNVSIVKYELFNVTNLCDVCSMCVIHTTVHAYSETETSTPFIRGRSNNIHMYILNLVIFSNG